VGEEWEVVVVEDLEVEKETMDIPMAEEMIEWADFQVTVSMRVLEEATAVEVDMVMEGEDMGMEVAVMDLEVAVMGMEVVDMDLEVVDMDPEGAMVVLEGEVLDLAMEGGLEMEVVWEGLKVEVQEEEAAVMVIKGVDMEGLQIMKIIRLMFYCS